MHDKILSMFQKSLTKFNPPTNCSGPTKKNVKMPHAPFCITRKWIKAYSGFFREKNNKEDLKRFYDVNDRLWAQMLSFSWEAKARHPVKQTLELKNQIQSSSSALNDILFFSCMESPFLTIKPTHLTYSARLIHLSLSSVRGILLQTLKALLFEGTRASCSPESNGYVQKLQLSQIWPVHKPTGEQWVIIWNW